MPGPAFTTGDTVSLHPVEEEDHEFIQRGRNEPSTRVPLTDTTIRSLGDVEEMLEESEYHYLICRRPEDGEEPEPVGVVAFAWSRDDEWGAVMYWVAPEHRREGHVSEALGLFLDYAFRERGFHKVAADVVAANDASVGTLESLGFEREGHFREEQFVDGEWVDAYRYGLLASEWLD